MGRFVPPARIGGNGVNAFACSNCNAMISTSDQLVKIGGTSRHRFVNPAGVNCEFLTLRSCHGVIADGPATEEYSWFSGYRWRLAFCLQCFQHLGWHYEAIRAWNRPVAFWGVLLDHLVVY